METEDVDPPYMSLTMPYFIHFNIRRLRQGNDDDNRAMVFRFHPGQHVFDGAQLVLLHITEHGLERVEVPCLNQYMPESVSEILKSSNWYNVHELCSDDVTPERASDTLTSNYQQLLVPGERYELFWPGAEIDMWGWGRREEYTTKELKCNSIRGEEEKLPRLILPATKVGAFTARAEDEPWPDRPKTKGVCDYRYREANWDEWRWRVEQESIRNPPPSPPPMEPADRVYVISPFESSREYSY